MAMCGLLIPAAEGSQISVFETVFANIGDTQSIEQNLSTFSAHMKQVIEILQQADDRSLVLLNDGWVHTQALCDGECIGFSRRT